MGFVNCISVSGLPITDRVSKLIYRAACSMAVTKSRRRNIRSEECEGLVTTEYKLATMVTISGVQFHAQVDTEEGTTTVEFIVRDFTLAEEFGEWKGYGSYESVAKAVKSAEQKERVH
jgi:hypothetical protein